MEKPQRKAFVTGAGGFLGTNLVLELLERNWLVYAMHRRGTFPPEVARYPNLVDVKCDLRDHASLESLVPENLDAIFHAGSLVSYWRLKDQEQYDTNVLSTRFLADLALRKKTKRFIHTSTILTYQYLPWKTITESTPLTGDKSWVGYIRTKRQGEMEVEKAIARGLDAVITNPGTIMGPYDYNTWSKMFTAIQNRDIFNGAPFGKPSWCHPRAVAEAHVAAFEKGRRGEHYLLGGVDMSFLEVTNLICRRLNRKPYSRTQPLWAVKLVSQIFNLLSYVTRKEPLITPELADVMQNTVVCSSDKAIRELGYKPVGMEQMIEDCYQWMVTTGRLKAA